MTTSPDPYLHTPTVATIEQPPPDKPPPGGELAHTGTETLSPVFAAVGLVLGGAALVAFAAERFRKNHPKENQCP